MRLITLFVLAMAASSLHAQSPKAARVKMPMPEVALDATPATPEQLIGMLGSLNRFIGTYPPQFKSDADRAKVYTLWDAALQKAWLLEKSAPAAEKTQFILSELYRQGHNMDIIGAGKRAMTTVDGCIKAYPDSQLCHLSAAYLYLSINPTLVPKAEASLLRLRQLAAPRIHSEAERGLVFVYLQTGRNQMALAQLDSVIAREPMAKWATDLRTALKDGKVEIKVAK